jgi:flagellar protein FliS
MAAHYARTAYLQAKVQPETDPKRLILMLYQGVLEDLRLAKEGIEQPNARKRGEHLSRAVAIVSTLFTSLDSNTTDESIVFLRGLYQSMLVELAKVAVTHDIHVLDLAFRYLERLKQIWEHDVMGLQTSRQEEQPQEAPRAVASAGAVPVVAQRSPYGAAAVVGQRTISV